MFQLSTKELAELGAEITTREIKQQPELWQETLTIYQEKQEAIADFLRTIKQKTDKRIRVVFTGAGTSQYVGDTIVPYLNKTGATADYLFESIATTDIVAAPEQVLFADEPTLLVSFARSGNSPESLAAVKIVDQFVADSYHLTITCAADGSLAQQAAADETSYLLLMPERSNDAGFAMTGSFSCMALSALLIFDQTPLTEKRHYVETLSRLGQEVIDRETELQVLTDRSFKRIVYLGSGTLSGLTREAQLKVLELTAGKIATVFDSSMGFRHGPKSFVDDQTLVFVFVSNTSYTRQYDLDMLEELKSDGIAAAVTAIGQPAAVNFSGTNFFFPADTSLPDGYLALADIVFAQTIALLASIKVGNTPDTPSPTRTVNRVVKGVTIHPYNN
ncbi:SIS domain-containing protein [Enterococcus casseliflavus]|uniref:SIS domain-containing protein n=1 Tax=Enterococcus casseliflavus TaxID=37734 RepID=UPI000763F672|nr:SIS domain-containing protein [Enterococcus casseliflavus]OJG32915.1 sugar isomerase, AgaS family [Enterococcus casseliflavus]QQU23609.1 SIS domain-containing protein [Enterococcus casseliflavus]STQ29513.1 sugar isomerase [Enterococcus casseliflavus]